MIEIKLSWHEVEMAAQVGLRRQMESMKAHLPDKHGYNGDGWSIHVEGAAGELAVAKALKRYWNGSFGTFKNGADVGLIQVRTRLDPTYDLIVRSDDRNEDWFVLVLGRCPKFTVVGYILGTDAKRPEWLQTYGGRPPAYFVPQSVLHPFPVTFTTQPDP